jgi:hypothetical protein
MDIELPIAIRRQPGVATRDANFLVIHPWHARRKGR